MDLLAELQGLNAKPQLHYWVDSLVDAIEWSPQTARPFFIRTFPGRCVSPPAGLVAWWPGDGNANDIVGLNDGTLQGGAIATGPGYVGSQAFSLSGSAQFVQVPDSPAIDVPKAISLDAWVFTANLDTPIFAKA